MHCSHDRRRVLKIAVAALPLAACAGWQLRQQRAIWSSDERFGFFRARDGLYWTTRDGRDGVFLPLGLSHALTPWSISPDMRHLAYTALDRRTGSNIWVAPILWKDHPVAGTPAPFHHGSFDIRPRFSSDGRQLTWEARVAGAWQQRMRPFVVA
jgi:hypothetical protein